MASFIEKNTKDLELKGHKMQVLHISTFISKHFCPEMCEFMFGSTALDKGKE